MLKRALYLYSIRKEEEGEHCAHTLRFIKLINPLIIQNASHYMELRLSLINNASPLCDAIIIKINE